ncbi:hypothetical protein L227DRAFT_646291 [Lentinus tigrinus ALCF2SS1-6]|uniref:Uncharacterized protein n=1 Tax=Lentinus tigrinus ALCF2SS1-6 TaxID=1328759 RepID=A0A5C2RNR2_9APHY|nr:hypothetical protein L227DRAFT_646291 [Lentinus tigrinus ALCF2SS1-6]
MCCPDAPGTFDVQMDGSVSHGGIFSATIKFNEPLQVAWVNASGDQVTLGSFSLDPLKVKSKRAYINQTLNVRAIAFPTAHGLHFKKDVTLNGMNKFDGHVSIVDFKLPRDDAAGGIVFSATTGLDNPSAYNVNLGTVVFDLSYKGLYLGTGSGANTVIKLGSNAVTLDGTLVPQRGSIQADGRAMMLTEESFDWVISGTNLSVAAIGISVPQIALSNKNVTLKGMNSLKGGVKIETFDLPSNDPDGGIHLTLQTNVTNPSQVGVELTSIGFQNFFQKVNIGPASATETFSLSPQSTIPLALTGRLIPQKEQSGLDAVSAMLNAFIHGKDSNIVVQADSAGYGLERCSDAWELSVSTLHCPIGWLTYMKIDDGTPGVLHPDTGSIVKLIKARLLPSFTTRGVGHTIKDVQDTAAPDLANTLAQTAPYSLPGSQHTSSAAHASDRKRPSMSAQVGSTTKNARSGAPVSPNDVMPSLAAPEPASAQSSDPQTAPQLLPGSQHPSSAAPSESSASAVIRAKRPSISTQGDSMTKKARSSALVSTNDVVPSLAAPEPPSAQSSDPQTAPQSLPDSQHTSSAANPSDRAVVPIKRPSMLAQAGSTTNKARSDTPVSTKDSDVVPLSARAAPEPASAESEQPRLASATDFWGSLKSGAHNEDFTWTISTDGVKLSKDISFKAFNNRPGVTISNFKLPSDDPAGGIQIETDSLMLSPAQLGIDLGTVTFEYSFKGTTVGSLTSNNLFLAPETTNSLHLSGRITPKSGDDVDVMGELFTNYLHAENQTLSVQGESVKPSASGSPVGWLSTAFKTLTLTVTLPGQKLDIIQSIEMSDLELVMTEQSQAFAPDASSKHILTQYKNPFGFSLQVVKSGEDITLAAQGTDVAQLKLPQVDAVGGVSTGNVAHLVLSFEHQTLQSVNNGAFAVFFAAVTDTSGIEFDLKGSADVVARTAIGDVPISAIAFDVTTSLKGINSFNKEASLSNVSITGSGHDGHGAYIKSPLTTTLQNPSNISFQTVNVALPVYYKDVMLGRAVIDPLNLVPGENTMPTEFHYQPNEANDTTAQAFLADFLQTGDDIALTIKGDGDSSPFASLVPALEGVGISTSLKGLNVPPIVTHINAFITLDTLIDNYITINFDIANPLDTDMEITFTQVDSGVDGDTYAHFDQAFDSFVMPAHSTANSGTVKNVLLVKGALASLGIIPLGKLDVFSTATVKIGEYTIPWLHLTTLDVPTTYSLSLSISAMKQAAASISASKGGITLSSSLSSSTASSGPRAGLPRASLSGSSGDASITTSPSSATSDDALLPSADADKQQASSAVCSADAAGYVNSFDGTGRRVF